MKVKDSAGSERAKKSSGASKSQKPPQTGGFLGALNAAEDKNVVERLRAMAADIVEQGEKLSEKIDIRELRVYKKMIADFLDEAIGNSRKFSKRSFLDRRGRHKVYAVIKRVNEELDLLTQDLLRTEQDRIRILNRIEDIKGLVLDLTM